MIESPKVKAWVEGVPYSPTTQEQVRVLASLPIVRPHVAVMPDAQYEAHGATVGTVIPTYGAIIPAAVGVDIGCGIVAVKTSLTQTDLPDTLEDLYMGLETVVPVGQEAWEPNAVPSGAVEAFEYLVKSYHGIVKEHPKIDGPKLIEQVGTLGGGNHFVEISADLDDHVWVMIHSGSRGVGNRIGRYFIDKAKEATEALKLTNAPPRDLSYLVEGEPIFKAYVKAVRWAQEYAAVNRRVMMGHVLRTMNTQLPAFTQIGTAINCHHNYVEQEKHFGLSLWVTRKGAINAAAGVRGVIPGSMGTPSFIVEGLGNPDSFNSSSHGAGRAMSRGEAKDKISLAEHLKATEGVMCRTDHEILDESPAAYKDVRAVMNAQKDLVKITAELHPLLVLKG